MLPLVVLLLVSVSGEQTSGIKVVLEMNHEGSTLEGLYDFNHAQMIASEWFDETDAQNLRHDAIEAIAINYGKNFSQGFTAPNGFALLFEGGATPSAVMIPYKAGHTNETKVVYDSRGGYTGDRTYAFQFGELVVFNQDGVFGGLHAGHYYYRTAIAGNTTDLALKLASNPVYTVLAYWYTVTVTIKPNGDYRDHPLIYTWFTDEPNYAIYTQRGFDIGFTSTATGFDQNGNELYLSEVVSKIYGSVVQQHIDTVYTRL